MSLKIELENKRIVEVGKGYIQMSRFILGGRKNIMEELLGVNFPINTQYKTFLFKVNNNCENSAN